MSENARELVKQLNESQAKHSDFLMVIAGSCIALTVQRTTGVPPKWSMLILAVAVLSWAASIWSGVRYRGYMHSIIYANVNLLQLQTGHHPDTPNHPDLVQAACEGIRDAVNKNNDTASFYAKAQFNLLLFGALFFIVWHVIEMFSIAKG